MASLFIKLLNLSISAGMLILLVFMLRFILKRTSRRATCLLWVVVGLRLVIPFSFESSLSIMPSGDFVKMETAPEAVEVAYTDIGNNIGGQSHKITLYDTTTDDDSEINYYIDSTQTNDFEKGLNNSKNEAEQSSIKNDNIEQSNNIKNAIEQDYTEQNNDVRIALPTQMPNDTVKTQSNNNDNIQRNSTDKSTSEDYYISSSNNVFEYPAKHFWGVIAYLWLFGVVAIMGYALVGYIHMKQITAASMKLEDTIISEITISRFKINLENVYICDCLDTAFIFGIIHPRIYLPSNLKESQIENIIAHEHVHIMRRDYIWKLIGFLMLAGYWFNPLVWLAYAFLCRDIEFACDEQVISGMSTDEVKRYSETLLYCSTNMHFMYGCPLAFGEIAVKDRVKAALNYKKPLFWVILLVFVLLITVGIFFFTKPNRRITEDSNNSNEMLSDKDFTTDNEIEEEYEAGDTKYYKLKNGMYKWENYIYKYRIEVDGTIADDDRIFTYVYLSNKEELSLSEVQHDLYMDATKYHFTPDVAKFVDCLVDGKSTLLKYKVDPDELEETCQTYLNFEYYKLKDGTYKYSGYLFNDRYEISGTVPDVANDNSFYDGYRGKNVKFVYLSNIGEISFERAWKDFSSINTEDKIPWSDAHMVDFIVLGDEDEDELMQTLKTGQNDRSVYELLNTMSMKYRYSVVHDFDFIYVMPNGTEFGTEFGYTAGMDFREYCKLWNDFEEIIVDESLTEPWRENRLTERGYLVLATNDGYDDSQYGYKIFIKDRYIHLFSVDKSKEEYPGEIDYRSPYQMRSSYNPQTDEYMWSARFKDRYQPNMYSIRRMLFNKGMYDIYVQNCDYENYMTASGIYYYNRGYCIDLDGDGEREKLFIASCGWINQPEPENIEGFVRFQGHYGTDYDTYFGNYPKSLIYINGELQNEDYRIADEVNLPYEFAITDIDRKDGRYEILLTYSGEHQVGDYFYIWKNGHLSEPKIFNGNILQITYDALAYETVGILSYYPEVKLTADFHRDGTFSGRGDVSIAGDFGYLRLYSDYITWRMDTDGNIKPVGDIFDIPVLYENEKEFMDSLVTTWSIEHWEEVMETDPEDLYREIYLKLELDLNVSSEPDGSSSKIHMPSGYVVIDKTDAKSKIHIRYMAEGVNKLVDSYVGLSGWIDLADIDSYVCDPEAFVKAKKENPYGTVIDALFSNLNHAG